MKLTWLGHACFALEQDGYRIVVDPYTGVDGYPPLRTEAHAVYCSHQHHDHNAVGCVSLLAPRESPFTVREIASFHDGEQGKLRGTNAIRVFTAGGVSVAHMGDLGHPLSGTQRAALGAVDVLLLPVGGAYTVDAQAAKAVCEAVKPRCVVPMHYRHAPYGIPVLTGVEDFLALWPAEAARRLDGASFEVTQALSGVIVPTYAPA